MVQIGHRQAIRRDRQGGKSRRGDIALPPRIFLTKPKDTLLTAALTVILQPTIDISPRHTDIPQFLVAHPVQYLGSLVHPAMTTSTLNDTISLTEHYS